MVDVLALLKENEELKKALKPFADAYCYREYSVEVPKTYEFDNAYKVMEKLNEEPESSGPYNTVKYPELNVNNYVWVKPTKEGAKLIGGTSREGEWYMVQLWVLINAIGGDSAWGGPAHFDKGMIRLTAPDS